MLTPIGAQNMAGTTPGTIRGLSRPRPGTALSESLAKQGGNFDLINSKNYFPGFIPGPAEAESSQAANEWQAPEIAALLRGKVM